MGQSRVGGRNVIIALGIICIVLVAGLAGTFTYYFLLIDEKNNTISLLNTEMSGKDSQISELNSTILGLNSVISALNGTISYLNSIVNVKVTNWPSQLLSNYVYDSGFFTLGPYASGTGETYRDLSIVGYRQVSVYVGFDNNLDVWFEIRVGMGDFNGNDVGGYNWATYYNISTVTGMGTGPFSETVDVRGPELRIEIYNGRNYSIDLVHIVVYVTC